MDNKYLISTFYIIQRGLFFKIMFTLAAKTSLRNHNTIETLLYWNYIYYFAGVLKGEVEVKVGTPATITCTITNIASVNGVSVTWKEGEQTLRDNIETTTVSNKDQASRLTVLSPQTDIVYTCIISSTAYPDSESYSQVVNLNVFGKTVLPW